jgi:hypothetical protein
VVKFGGTRQGEDGRGSPRWPGVDEATELKMGGGVL